MGIDVSGTDYAGYCRDSDRWQHLIVRKGKVFEIVSYTGDVDLRDRLELVLHGRLELELRDIQ